MSGKPTPMERAITTPTKLLAMSYDELEQKLIGMSGLEFDGLLGITRYPIDIYFIRVRHNAQQLERLKSQINGIDIVLSIFFMGLFSVIITSFLH